MVFTKETRSSPNLLELEPRAIWTRRHTLRRQENVLIKMELSFSALAAVSGWPFVVAVLKTWFFPPSSSSPNSLEALTQTL